MVAVGAVIGDGEGRILLVKMLKKGVVSGRVSGFARWESWNLAKRLKRE